MRISLALMWCLHFLPLPILGRIGELFGGIFYRIKSRRRHITLTNLSLCFPELTQPQREQLAIQHFKMYGRSILERGILWWSSERRIRKLIRIEPGVPHDFIAHNPVILLCPHFVCLDVGAVGLSLAGVKGCSVYSQQKNELFDDALKKGRSRFAAPRIFTRSQGIKPIIRAMREGFAFFMLPDMDFGTKDAEFVPFFGVPAATLTAPARIAAAVNAKVIPIIATMLPNYQGWRITIHPALENFPGNDILAATHYINTFLEQQIRLAPAEYLWSHRRFKTRPPGEPDLYR